MHPRPHSFLILFPGLLFLSLLPGSAEAQTLVYSNTPPASPTTYRPGAGIFVSDDLVLDGGPAAVSRYEVKVFSSVSSYSVTTTLYSGDPCVGNPSAIPNTSKTFTNLGVGSINTLTVDLNPAVNVPGTVYVRLTFNDADAGWLIAGAVEVGSSQDLICQDQTSGNDPGYLTLGTFIASMAVEVWAESTVPVKESTWGLMKARYGVSVN